MKYAEIVNRIADVVLAYPYKRKPKKRKKARRRKSAKK
jgi:hypothetical protein